MEKNKNIIIHILRDSYKKSFKFIGGLSDNLINSDKLINVIKNIINYYFHNEIKNLQSELNDVSFSIKKLFFDKLIEDITNEIIKNLNILDSSPNINIIENSEKESLHIRCQKIFLKY